MKLKDPVSVAKEFASSIHADQEKFYDAKPYVMHLEQVANVLLYFGFYDRTILAAAYLHDLLEDTEVPRDVVEKLFGYDIFFLVTSVTDEPGKNRKERKARTYPKIKHAGENAVALKLADRIANFKYAMVNGDRRMMRMYMAEHVEFSSQLRTLGQLDNMWNYLEQRMADAARILEKENAA